MEEIPWFLIRWFNLPRAAGVILRCHLIDGLCESEEDLDYVSSVASKQLSLDTTTLV